MSVCFSDNGMWFYVKKFFVSFNLVFVVCNFADLYVHVYVCGMYFLIRALNFLFLRQYS